MHAEAAMLAEVPIFELLDENERLALAQMMDCREFKAGATLFEYGDPGGEIYIIRSGVIEVFVVNPEGEKIIIAEDTHGDVVGELSFLDGGHRTATAFAREDTQALSMHRNGLLDFIDKHPHAAIDLLTVVGRRLRATDELLRTRVSRNVNVQQEESMTFAERLADKVAAFGGSWTFIMIFAVIMLVWILINSVSLFSRHFDPYPYILLNLVLAMIAAIQAPVIMMSQNRQATKDRLQADQDYEVNLKAELEVAQLHHKLDHLHARLEEYWEQVHGNKD